MKLVPALLTLLILAACGDTPFDEDYWEDDLEDRQEQAEGDGQFSSNLTPVSALSFSSGNASIDLNGNSITLNIEMQGVPQNISQGQLVIMDESCEQLVVTPPSTGSLETKNFSYTETGTRAAVFANPGSDMNVEGKSLVLYAFVIATPATPASALFPLACGVILRPENDDDTSLTGGTLAGGTATGTTGTNSGATTGSTVGSTGGTLAGTVGGTTVSVTTGSVDETTATSTVGVTAGTVGTTTGLTIGGGFASGGSTVGATTGTTGFTTGGGFTAGGSTIGVNSGTTAGSATGTTGATLGTTFGGAEGD